VQGEFDTPKSLMLFPLTISFAPSAFNPIGKIVNPAWQSRFLCALRLTKALFGIKMIEYI